MLFYQLLSLEFFPINRDQVLMGMLSSSVYVDAVHAVVKAVNLVRPHYIRGLKSTLHRTQSPRDGE